MKGSNYSQEENIKPLKNISFSPPDISEEEISEVVDTLRSGWITTGPKTKQFEKEIAAFCNTSKAVCLNSATAAMELTLRLLGIGEGDEVITTAYTYTATASVIEHVGAHIVLVDTAENSFHLDYEQLAEAITPKTKAIMPVDIGGAMCDYDKIFEVVKQRANIFNPSNDLQKKFNRVIILADGAHSFGAEYNGMKSGEAADFTCFSFHAVKNLTTGEGGAVTWRDKSGLSNEEIYKEYMLLSLHGQSKDALAKSEVGSWEYDIVAPNYKSNMTDISASLGIGQLRRYPEILKRRKEIVEKYNNNFKSDHLDVLKHFGVDFSSSCHLYLLRFSNKEERFRNDIVKRLAEKGIAVNVHYKPLPLLSAYKKMGFNIKDYPNAFEMYKNEVSLPLHNLLSDNEVEIISEEVLNCLK